MGSLASAVAAVLLSMPCPAEEPTEACHAWRRTVAEHVADAAERAACVGRWSVDCTPVWKGTPEQLAAWLLEVGYHESGFRKRIQAGDCRENECDAVRVNGELVFLARSMWQFHRIPRIGEVGSMSAEDWRLSLGTKDENVARAAWVAARFFAVSPQSFGVTPGKTKRRQAWSRLHARLLEAKRANEGLELVSLRD